MKKENQGLKNEIETFVEDWHCDEETEIYAFEMGKFLFSFIDYLKDQKLSERTISNEWNNIEIIGMFETGYGYNEEFYPENLEDGQNYLYEFKKKISDSKYAVQSYKSTWKKLDQYIKTAVFEKYLERIEEKLQKEE